ncbi:kinetochore-associated protein DSN1 homolog isoform X1 [Pleurodeles waltl]|uniref:kinetochore-associated protein DSN1 homolog isoform X1 n=1 Tax=Pleurodeles waltl TaxID=8319 RepID=UPI00370941EA
MSHLEDQTHLDQGPETGDICAGVLHCASERSSEKMETPGSSSQRTKSPVRNGSVPSSLREETGTDQEERNHASPVSKLISIDNPSPQKKSPSKPSPKKRWSTSPVPLSYSPDRKRRSWRRSSMKGNNSRKSLPPMHCDNSGLSKSISLELSEPERLCQLLQSCFQFSIQKLQESLKSAVGFSSQDFKSKVSSITQELNHFTERLQRDGTLQRCTEEPSSTPTNPALEDAKAQIREYIERFTKECHSWEQILLSYQKTAMERARQLEEMKCKKVYDMHATVQGTSQDKVLKSKPNYQKILSDQFPVIDYMELVIDELQQAIFIVRSFMEENSQYLKSISTELALRSFQQIEDSPLRRYLKVSKKARS